MKQLYRWKRRLLIKIMTVLGFGGMAAFCITGCDSAAQKKDSPAAAPSPEVSQKAEPKPSADANIPSPAANQEQAAPQPAANQEQAAPQAAKGDEITDDDIKEYTPTLRWVMEFVFKLEVFQQKDFPLEKLREETSLQRAMKKYILNGGNPGEAYAVLNQERVDALITRCRNL